MTATPPSDEELRLEDGSTPEEWAKRQRDAFFVEVEELRGRKQRLPMCAFWDSFNELVAKCPIQTYKHDGYNSVSRTSLWYLVATKADPDHISTMTLITAVYEEYLKQAKAAAGKLLQLRKSMKIAEELKAQEKAPEPQKEEEKKEEQKTEKEEKTKEEGKKAPERNSWTMYCEMNGGCLTQTQVKCVKCGKRCCSEHRLSEQVHTGGSWNPVCSACNSARKFARCEVSSHCGLPQIGSSPCTRCKRGYCKDHGGEKELSLCWGCERTVASMKETGESLTTQALKCLACSNTTFHTCRFCKQNVCPAHSSLPADLDYKRVCASCDGARASSKHMKQCSVTRGDNPIHQCQRSTDRNCTACLKPICMDHVWHGELCPTCARCEDGYCLNKAEITCRDCKKRLCGTHSCMISGANGAEQLQRCAPCVRKLLERGNVKQIPTCEKGCKQPAILLCKGCDAFACQFHRYTQHPDYCAWCVPPKKEDTK